VNLAEARVGRNARSRRTGRQCLAIVIAADRLQAGVVCEVRERQLTQILGLSLSVDLGEYFT
jgi:hypothetical protein